MDRIQTKHTAEAVLRELPSVVGVCVREDARGHPREVHLLVRDGPNLRDLAHDVRELLQERLGLFIDQRIISIAQLAGGPPRDEREGRGCPGPSEAASQAMAGEPAPSRRATGRRRPPRLVLEDVDARLAGGKVQVRVRLLREGVRHAGECLEVDAGHGRARAAAAAALRAASAACGGALRIDLEAASAVRALERDYALVSATAVSRRLGRRPLPVMGAHPVEGGDVVTGAALAALKATNRLVERALAELASARERE